MGGGLMQLVAYGAQMFTLQVILTLLFESHIQKTQTSVWNH